MFEGLTAGLYLLNELRAEQGDAVYIFGSFLVSVPGIDENGKWVYDVTAKPKSVTVNPSGDEITYRVVKVWKGGGDIQKRCFGQKRRAERFGGMDVFVEGN